MLLDISYKNWVWFTPLDILSYRRLTKTVKIKCTWVLIHHARWHASISCVCWQRPIFHDGALHFAEIPPERHFSALLISTQSNLFSASEKWNWVVFAPVFRLFPCMYPPDVESGSCVLYPSPLFLKWLLILMPRRKMNDSLQMLDVNQAISTEWSPYFNLMR